MYKIIDIQILLYKDLVIVTCPHQHIVASDLVLHKTHRDHCLLLKLLSTFWSRFAHGICSKFTFTPVALHKKQYFFPHRPFRFLITRKWMCPNCYFPREPCFFFCLHPFTSTSRRQPLLLSFGFTTLHPTIKTPININIRKNPNFFI